MTPPRTRKLTTWYLLSGWMYVTVPVNGLRSFFGYFLSFAWTISVSPNVSGILCTMSPIFMFISP